MKKRMKQIAKAMDMLRIHIPIWWEGKKKTVVLFPGGSVLLSAEALILLEHQARAMATSLLEIAEEATDMYEEEIREFIYGATKAE